MTTTIKPNENNHTNNNNGITSRKNRAPFTLDCSQCYNESLDLLRLIVRSHPSSLVESRIRVSHHWMHSGVASEVGAYYSRLGNLLWIGRAASKLADNYTRINMRMGEVQTNYLPGLDSICHKVYLARKLHLFQRLFEQDYHFVPRTWILPEDTDKLKSWMDAQTATNSSSSPPTLILKPSCGSQGLGIHLVQKWSDVQKCARETSDKLIVQEYIDKPLLLSGANEQKKFDFRIYVLITCLKPLKVQVFQDGLARFCTEAYVPPTSKNLSRSFIHLTNSSLNKQNADNFKVEKNEIGRTVFEMEEKEHDMSKDDGDSECATQGPCDADSSKRSIRTVLTQLRADYVKQHGALPADHVLHSDNFWRAIRNMVDRTLCCLWSSMWAHYYSVFPFHQANANASAQSNSSLPFSSPCFHLVGFDVLFSSDYRLWLLEINCSPSLNIDTRVDLLVKRAMLEKALINLGYIDDKKRLKEKDRDSPKDNDFDSEKESRITSQPIPISTQTRTVAPPRPSASGRPPVRPPPLLIPTPLSRLANNQVHTATQPTPPVAQPSPLPSTQPLPPLSVSAPSGSNIKFIAVTNNIVISNNNYSIPSPSSATASALSSSPSPPPQPSPSPPAHRRSASGTRYVFFQGGCRKIKGRLSPANPLQEFEEQHEHDSEWVDVISAPPLSVMPSTSPYLTHPLLFAQHPYLQTLFSRYTTPSKPMSSSRFAQCCVACKLIGKGFVRADADLLFMQHAKSSIDRSLDFDSFVSCFLYMASHIHKDVRADIALITMLDVLMEQEQRNKEKTDLKESINNKSDSPRSSTSVHPSILASHQFAAKQFGIAVIPSAPPSTSRRPHTPPARVAVLPHLSRPATRAGHHAPAHEGVRTSVFTRLFVKSKTTKK